MFFPEDRVRVWLYAQPADMRKQFDGLAALVKHQLAEDPLSGRKRSIETVLPSGSPAR